MGRFVLHAYRVKRGEELQTRKFADLGQAQEFAFSLLKEDGDEVSVWAEASSGTLHRLETSVFESHGCVASCGPRSRPSSLAERLARDHSFERLT